MRGLCILLMILDHLALLVCEFYAPYWYETEYYYFIPDCDAFSAFCHSWIMGGTRPIIHNIVLLFFFGISGISSTLSRSNLKRGSGLAIIAILYSFCSLFGEKVMYISGITTVFGVLDFLAVCILLYALISWACKGDKWHISIVATGLIGITLILYFCYTPPANTPLIFATVFPPYDVHGNPSLFYDQSYFSPGDLFTLIPYSAYFFFGVLIAPVLYGKRKSLLPKLDGKWNKPLCFIGRHALIIYIVHVAALALLLSLISFVFITPGKFIF